MSKQISLSFICFFVRILTSNDVLIEVSKINWGIGNSFKAILFLWSILEIRNLKFLSNQFYDHFILGIRNSNFDWGIRNSNELIILELNTLLN